jgi:protein phosphatase
VPKGEVLVIGDLHGDLQSLQTILMKSDYIVKMAKDKDARLVFLGDYGDRGPDSVEAYYTILKLKLEFPNQTFLLRGNHEGPDALLAYPHDLPQQFEFKFGEKWTEAYARIRELFHFFYNAVKVENRFLMVHGGLPAKIKDISQLARTNRNRSGESDLEDLLWNDPDDEIQGTAPSPRGAGKLFGKDVTQTVLDTFGVKILIRGHEPAIEGYKINHEGKVLTLFSRKGPPYFNTSGAYLEVPLAENFENATQLIPFIHKF